MFAGHLGVGLALKKADKRINLGWLFFASLLPDFILGILVLTGIEKIIIPPNYDHLHYVRFDFPFSHGLTAIIVWSLLVFGLAKLMWPKDSKGNTKPAMILAAAVFLHFLADLVVHIAEIPVLGRDSYKIGLGLWNHLTFGLLLEVGLAVAGIIIYLKCTKGSGFLANYGILLSMILLTTFTVVGMTMAPAPPNTTGPALTFIIQPIIISALAFWLDRKRKNS